MDIEQIKILLERYNQGNCSPEEAAIVEQWFENINRQQSTYIDDRAVDKDLDRIKQQLNEQLELTPAPKVRLLRRRYRYIAAAAVLVLLATGMFWASRQAMQHQDKAPSLAASGHVGRVIRDGYIEISTSRGKKESIALEDGSTIDLNAASKVRYPVHFGDSSRTVSLEEGEAFFTVAADPVRHFVVNTGELSTTALGTSFNIRAYSSEHKVVVAIVNGKVKVDQVNPGKENTSVILLPKEQISYDRLSLSIVKTNFNKADDITGWKQGYLIFKDAPYNELVTGIENRYGVTVINQSDKKEWNYNGSFKNESLKDVMDIICLAKSLNYTIKNDTVYLQNKN